MLITITGASGSGKTCISDYLCSLDTNIVHLNIDTVGHKVLEIPEIMEIILKQFNLQLKDGKIDRTLLGNLVFNNHEKMKMLTDITWKKMEESIDEFIEEFKDKIVILDYILMPKTKYFKISDMNILVKADFNTRMRRATTRDRINDAKFIEREKATLNYNENDFDYIIQNDDIEKTKRKVKIIYDESIISG